MKLDAVFIFMAHIFVEKRGATRLANAVQHIPIDRHSSERRFEILIGQGIAMFQARLARTEDDEHIGNRGFLYFSQAQA